MMHQDLLSTLVYDFGGGVRDRGIYWQVLVLAASIVFGWGTARVLRGRLAPREPRQRVVRLGVDSFSRVISPMLALSVIVSARWLLDGLINVNLLRLAIPLVASFALIRLFFYVLRRVFARSGNAGSFLLLFEKVFAGLVWAAVALYVTGAWPELLRYLERTVIPVGRHQASLLTIAQAALSVLVTLMIALWAGAALEERLMQMDSVHSSLRVVMARMGRALLILLAVLVSLSLVGIDLTVLSVFGGALGVGIGLGMQKIVGSYVSGFVILLERSLAIGDMVAVDKYFGQVTRINARYTIVRGLDGIETVVPNDMLVSGPVQNYSLTDRSLRLSTQVCVAYQTDVEMVLSLLPEVAARIARVSAEPAPQSYLMRFGADGFELELGFWISDPENGRANVLSEVNRAIWKSLQEHQVTIPYPQREVKILATPGEAESGNRPIKYATENA